MPWVEKRRNGWIVRSQKDGKVTSRYFDDESEARYYARMGKPFPITSAGIINQLQESTGKPRKKRSPKLGDYALEVIAHDTNIGQGSRDAYAATIRNHVVDSVIDVPITDVEPAMVRRYSGLRPTKNYAAAGNGMRSSVIRVLSKVFKQAVNDGIIPSSPLSRSGVKRTFKAAFRPDPSDEHRRHRGTRRLRTFDPQSPSDTVGGPVRAQGGRSRRTAGPGPSIFRIVVSASLRPFTGIARDDTSVRRRRPRRGESSRSRARYRRNSRSS